MSRAQIEIILITDHDNRLANLGLNDLKCKVESTGSNQNLSIDETFLLRENAQIVSTWREQNDDLRRQRAKR